MEADVQIEPGVTEEQVIEALEEGRVEQTFEDGILGTIVLDTDHETQIAFFYEGEVWDQEEDDIEESDFEFDDQKEVEHG